MGIFTPKPYKMDTLGIAERAAVISSMEVAIEIGGNAPQVTQLRTALKEFRKGAISESSRVIIMACLAATLSAISSGDDSDLRTTMLKQKAVTQVALALALDKLKNMG